MNPLFVPGGLGGPERLIVLAMLAFYFAIPILVIVAIFYVLDGRRGYDRRIVQLVRRVEELENERR